MMNNSTLMIWIGIALVLLVLVQRWRLGAWEIDTDKGPPKPATWTLFAMCLGLVLVGWGSYLLLQDY